MGDNERFTNRRVSRMTHRLTEEQLEKQLRSLPDVDPPADLAERVMALVLADESVQADSHSAAVKARRRRSSMWGAPWYIAAVPAVIASVLAVLVLGHSWPALIRVVGNAGVLFADVVRFVADVAMLSVTIVGALLSKIVVTLTAFGTVMRTVGQVVLTEGDSLVLVAAGVAVGLQWALASILRRRHDES